MPEEALVRAVVEAATRAPSIHNTQPWRFVAHDDVVELWADPERAVPAIDPDGRSRHLSCGAALALARVAAAAQGVATSATVLPDPTEPDHLADLHLDGPHETDADDQALADAIGARHTERGDLAGELRERPVVRARGIGGAASGNCLGLHRWRAVAEAVADVGEHVGQLGVRVGIHRHHGCAVIDPIQIALQAMKNDGDGGAFIAEYARRAGERRRDRAAVGAGLGSAVTVGGVAGETDGVVERAARAPGLEPIHA